MARHIMGVAMSIFSEFKTFITKGNVMDLAVGVIIGGAFGGIVTSLVKDVITPTIAMISPKPIDFSSIAIGGHWIQDPTTHVWSFVGGIMIGNFINAIFSFLILAGVVFFFLVKPMNSLMAKINPPPPPGAPPPTPEDVLLLREIRDELKKQAA
jgi:large conductance mechanosensitive channel